MAKHPTVRVRVTNLWVYIFAVNQFTCFLFSILDFGFGPIDAHMNSLYSHLFIFA